MRTSIVVAACAAAFAAETAVAAPKTDARAPQGVFQTIEAAVTTEIADVDKDARRVTIKDPRGREVELSVPQGIDVSKLEKGAKMRLRYLDGVALAIVPEGQAPPAAQRTVRVTPRGARSEQMATVQTVTARIHDIDQGKREMLVGLPQGKDLKLQVPEGTPGFEKAKIGDMVVLQHTEAVLIDAQPQK